MASPTPVTDDLDRLLDPWTARTPSEERLATALRTLRIDLVEGPGSEVRRAHLNAICAAISGAKRTAVLSTPDELALRRAQRDRSRRTQFQLMRTAVVAAAFMMLAMSSLAVAGTLPTPLQRAVADTARFVGIHLPSPEHIRPDGPAGRDATGPPGLSDPADRVASVPPEEEAGTEMPSLERRHALTDAPDGAGEGGRDPAVPPSADAPSSDPPPENASPSAPSAEDPAEELSEGPAEEPSDGPSEGPAEEPSDGPSEELSDGPAEEPSDGPAEELSEDPAEELSDGPSEGLSDEESSAPDRALGSPTDTASREPEGGPEDGPRSLVKTAIQVLEPVLDLSEADDPSARWFAKCLADAEGAGPRCDQYDADDRVLREDEGRRAGPANQPLGALSRAYEALRQSREATGR